MKIKVVHQRFEKLIWGFHLIGHKFLCLFRFFFQTSLRGLHLNAHRTEMMRIKENYLLSALTDLKFLGIDEYQTCVAVKTSIKFSAVIVSEQVFVTI